MGDVALLQALLAAEHAAVYGYGVLGARLDDVLRAQAQQAAAGHRARRDQLTSLLLARGATTPAPAAAYDVAVTAVPDALALAVRLETGLGVRWHDLVGGTDAAALRTLGLAGLTGTAVVAARWRRAQGAAPPTTAFPGVDARD